MANGSVDRHHGSGLWRDRVLANAGARKSRTAERGAPSSLKASESSGPNRVEIMHPVSIRSESSPASCLRKMKFPWSFLIAQVKALQLY